MSETRAQDGQTPDDEPTPCPKCASHRTWMRYCDGCKGRTYASGCRHGEPEHNHRGCRRCQYRWRTDDVIDAKVMCDQDD